MKLMVLVLIASAIATTAFLAPNATAASEPFDIVVVDSDGQTYWSKKILQNDISYRIEAIGVWQHDSPTSNDLHQSDAKYSSLPNTNGSWSDSPFAGGLCVSGWMQPGNMPWGPYNIAHVYYYTVSGNGEKIGFWIYDTYYPDNYGSLTVKLYEIETPIPQQVWQQWWFWAIVFLVLAVAGLSFALGLTYSRLRSRARADLNPTQSGDVSRNSPFFHSSSVSFSLNNNYCYTAY